MGIELILMALGVALIFLGLVGAIVPVLPGPIFIWIGILIWSWADGFVRVGWPVLAVLAVLTVAAWGSDLFLTTVSSRQAGVSWRSIGLSILGGIAGAVILSFVPIIGTLVGAIVGAVLTLWYSEYQIKGDREAATVAVKAYIKGYALSVVVEVTICLVMIGLFLWQIFG